MHQKQETTGGKKEKLQASARQIPEAMAVGFLQVQKYFHHASKIL